MSAPDSDDEVLDTTYIFSRVAAQLADDENARSLWLKLEQEVAAGGVVSATGYLRARFNELSERVKGALTPGGRS